VFVVVDTHGTCGICGASGVVWEGVCRACIERTAHLALTSPRFILATLWQIEGQPGFLPRVEPERIEELMSSPGADRVSPQHPVELARALGTFPESLYVAAKSVVRGDEVALALAPHVFFDARQLRPNFAARLRRLLAVE